MRLIRIAEFAINLVRKEEKIMLACDFSECEHALLRILGSGRISRVAYEDSLGLLCDGLLELFDRRNLESVSDVGRDGLESKAVHECESIVVCVEWLKNDNLVSRITCDFKCKIYTLAAGNGHDEFIYIDVDSDLTVVLLHEALAKLHKSC